MLNTDYIANNAGEFIKYISSRKVDSEFLKELKEIPMLNNSRRDFIRQKQLLETTNNRINSIDLPKLKKEIDKDDNRISEKIKIVKENNKEIEAINVNLEECEKKLRYLLSNCPNIPLFSEKGPLIPIGEEEAYKEVKKVGKIPHFEFAPKSHEKIGEVKGYLDFKQTAKISGSRFVTLRGKVAKLEQALISFMLKMHTNEHGYELVSPPYLVKNESMFGVGQLPKFSEDSFIVDSGAPYGQEKVIEFNSGYRLIPTAEVPLTNMLANKIAQKSELPIRFVAVTPCFRSEIGSAGRDVTGIMRLHQFMKVELVSLTSADEETKLIRDLEQRHNPDNIPSNELHRMRNCATRVLDELNLPYRIICLPSDDTGFSSRITYDIEAWMPSQDKYREISSCSYFGDFQCRRMAARYKDDEGKNKILHSFNGSALAIGRTIAAIMENFQTADGDFEIPDALKKYM